METLSAFSVMNLFFPQKPKRSDLMILGFCLMLSYECIEYINFEHYYPPAAGIIAFLVLRTVKESFICIHNRVSFLNNEYEKAIKSNKSS